MINEKRKSYDASYTVEAALVLPIVFFVILFLLNYTFYCYDRAKLQAKLDDILRKSSLYMAYDINLENDRLDMIEKAKRSTLWVLFGDRSQKESMLKDFVEQRLKGDYYITKINGIRIKTSFHEIIISGTATMKLVGLDWLNGLICTPFDIKFGQTAVTFPREEKTRILQALVELGTQIKGADKLLEKVSCLLEKIR